MLDAPCRLWAQASKWLLALDQVQPASNKKSAKEVAGKSKRLTPQKVLEHLKNKQLKKQALSAADKRITNWSETKTSICYMWLYIPLSLGGLLGA